MKENQQTQDFIQMEHDVLKFWQDNRSFDKLVEKNKDNKPFRFLDGPITANNPMGVHHAWGRSIKDTFIRYKAMNGYSCHYRNGFDTQGLWVELEVEKELGFKNKGDIEAYGLDKFTNKCIERIEKYSGIITDQSVRLGQWMDWDNSYYTHTDENIEGIWHFLNICHENGWIEQAERPMTWCPRCGTSLSEHEMAGSHQQVTHTAVFAAVPIKGKDFKALVWTTTPWTLAANVALAVNPDEEYALLESEHSDKPVVLMKDSIDLIEGEKKVLDIFKGSELVGLEYETFFPALPAQKDVTHRIVAWDDVTPGEGSGIVHIAPGCGVEDFELAQTEGLVAISPVDENGEFYDDYDFLAGHFAADVPELVFEHLKKQNKLFYTHEYEHSYPVCWRCKTEVIFRLVEEWQIATDEIRPRLIEASKTVQWEPGFIGKRMEDWLLNMGDWTISRKRFYGLPLPFYPCECGHLTVIGSKEELRELGGEAVDDLPQLHRPWIDAIEIECPECHKKVKRVTETGDVWLDAGIVPFSTQYYFSDREKWETYFPAEWITEMREQVRLWFYSMLFMSVTMLDKAPYERVLAFSSVVQEDGTKFSKTGTMIEFDDAAETIGSDAIRYLYAGTGHVNDVRFGYNLGEEARRKLLGLWNIYSFFMTYAAIDEPTITDDAPTHRMDLWLQARIARFVDVAVDSYEAYATQDLVREFEVCIDDVSNWYVRRGRRRFWKEGMDQDKQDAYNSLYRAVKTICQVMAPIIPFGTEHMWQHMIRRFGTAAESVHLTDFPKKTEYDEALLQNTAEVRDVIAAAMKLRNEQQLRVRQPLATLYIDAELETVCRPYEQDIKDELNVEDIVYLEDFSTLSDEFLTLNFAKAGPVLQAEVNNVKTLLEKLEDKMMKTHVASWKEKQTITVGEHALTHDLLTLERQDKEHVAKSTEAPLVALDLEITDALKEQGIYREILRHCQVLRKDAGFDVSDQVTIQLQSDDALVNKVLKDYGATIEKEALATLKEVPAPVKETTFDIDGVDIVARIQ